MKKYLLYSFSLWLSLATQAQNLVPDVAFGQDGIATFSHAKGNERIRAIHLLSDGKILLAGHTLRATRDFVLMRQTSTGALDATFGTGGMVYTDFGGLESVNSMAVQSDGKILLAGSSKATAQEWAIARYLPNGTPDVTFGVDGMLSFAEPGSTLTQISDIKVLADNKILFCGYSLVSSAYKAFVRKMNANGSLDPTFGTSGIANIPFTASGSQYANGLGFDSNGNILVLGQQYSTRFVIGVAKLSPDGTLNTAFSTDGVMTHSFANSQNYSASIHGLPDGKILITGYATATGQNYKGYAARLSAEGTLDAAYGTAGQTAIASGTAYNGLYASTVLADGSLVATGEAFVQNRYQGTVFKVTSGGALDATFGTAGVAFFSPTPVDAFGNGIVATATGVWAAGAEYSTTDNAYKNIVVNLNANGQANTGFGNGGRSYIASSNANTVGYRLAETATGGYYVSGSLENLDQDQFIQRISANGTADATFATAGLSKSDFGSEDLFAEHIVESNGGVIQLAQTGSVSLTFTGLGTFTGPPDYSLTRVSPTTGIQSNSQAKFRFSSTHFTRGIRLQKDLAGKPVVLAFQQSANQRAAFLQRHKSGNLSLDSTFATNGKYQLHSLNFPSEYSAVDFMIDGQGAYYVLYHIWNQATSTAGFRLTKTDDAMQAIPSFGSGSILPGTFEVLEASANSVAGGRLFQTANGFVVTGSRNQVRTLFVLNANGSAHTEITLADFKTLSEVLPNADGSFLVGGVNTEDKIQFARVTAAGQLDASFNGTGRLVLSQLNAPTEYRDALLDAQNRLVVLAGNPQSDGSGEPVTVVRYVLVTGTEKRISPTEKSTFLYPNPANETVFWSDRESAFEVQIMDAAGRRVGRTQHLPAGAGVDVSHLKTGLYRLLISANGKQNVIGFVKE